MQVTQRASMPNASPVSVSMADASNHLIKLERQLVTATPGSRIRVATGSLSVHSVDTPGAFDTCKSLSAVPVHVLQLHTSPVAFAPSIYPAPGYSILAYRNRCSGCRSAFPTQFAVRSSSVLSGTMGRSNGRPYADARRTRRRQCTRYHHQTQSTAGVHIRPHTLS